MTYYTYILTNKYNKVIYVGFTNDLKKRILEHKNKKYKNSFSGKYNVDKLVYFESHKTAQAARKREILIKNWNREWKNNLVNDMNPDWNDLGWML
ncbi:GIY-YIG nuclease family protein [Dokdonia sinensis]|uniref:GIY-YIG nuclease family protein n=1 Tax=Dokdonia sinensis TaxID=2479847 RepID=A0A3M0G2R2_9FLAO|nr:GIY-YIG nuclease family protein [Dokdonia sinensis]RMB56193.1 GIY-YIG nuclease family protein [Dokdonia sinensis]